MKVSVVGLGKLGLPLACCWADAGFETVGIDRDQSKVDLLNQSIAPYYEANLQEYLDANKERLTITTDVAAIKDTDVTFIIVPTPSAEDHAFTNRYILNAIESIGSVLAQKNTFHVIVIVSTVMPGSMNLEIKVSLEKYGKTVGQDLGLCYNPEFIALGNVIHDLQNPDMILMGESDHKTGDLLEELYKKFCKNNPAVLRMNFINAELVKLLLNTFVTMKISYANMISQLCEQMPGANVDIISAALGSDTRIGKKYLKGGLGYGGPCFPRDNLALIKAASMVGLEAKLAEATHAFNHNHTQHLGETIVNRIPANATVGILGLAYKPSTDVTEESQGICLANELMEKGFKVIVFDPAAKFDLPTATSAEALIAQSDALVIATPWADFVDLDCEGKVVFDCWRILKNKPKHYIPLGVGI